MREKIARALGLSGFLVVAGGVGSFEQGMPGTTCLVTIAAGLGMMALSMFWYKYQSLKAERYMDSLEYRRAMHYENGIERRAGTH